ncbi:Oidioi.mRNA.OKI2018_I69.chr1.g3679.t1.cds [Oikopleura dioica]|uniref:Carbohydrate sulfotransferase n=1 Tax=Oikopleura dioica TaxID=34765 RepID=A0ABN7T439_OIKDI|nr:Oidioi.mRNA.OKI2018_I69.chr1.g3679.t1.cds [Oikopleura dioica]
MKNIMLFMLSLVGLTLVWLILLASTVSLSDTRSYEVSRSVQKLEKEEALDARKTNSSIIQAPKEIEENPRKIKEDQQKIRLEKNRAFCENKKFQDSSKFELYGKSSGNVGFKTCLVAKAASTSLSMAYLLATGRLDSSKKLTLEDVTSGDERFNRKCASLLDGCLVKRSPRTVPISERVVFVREPMQRLYSAYRDKIARIRDRAGFNKDLNSLQEENPDVINEAQASDRTIIRAEKAEYLSKEMKDDHLEMRLKKHRAFCQKKNTHAANSRDSLLDLYGKSSGNVGFKTCLVAKAASTSLTTALLLATGRLDSSKKLTLDDVTAGDERFNRKCTSVQNGCLVRRSPKTVPISERIIFVREPMDRLYSAYKDRIARLHDRPGFCFLLVACKPFIVEKVEPGGRDWYYEKYTRFMKPNAPATAELAIKQNFSVSFEEFVSWLVSNNKFSADMHWKPQFTNCQPCQYSFIGHVETIAEDLDALFSRLKVSNLTSSHVFAHSDSVNPHRTSSTKNNSAKTETATLEEILRKLPKNHRDALLSHYRQDYEAFGYDLPDYLL